MANNSEEGQGSQTAVVPMMMMMMNYDTKESFSPPKQDIHVLAYLLAVQSCDFNCAVRVSPQYERRI
jgi:hypothetical protein